MPRGGRRTGTPGKTYPNRSDLQAQPVRTVPGQQYGKATAQANAQRAIPMAGPSVPPAPPAAPNVVPGQLGALDRGTDRPDEHVMTGAPLGPGGGPEMNPLTLGPAQDVIERLRAVYLAYPLPEIADLLAEAARG